MLQIAWNWLIIFILPFMAGLIIRFLFRNKAKGWIVSLIIGILVLAAAIAAVALTVWSERCWFICIHTVCALVGSLLTGAITRVRNKQEG